MKFDAFEVRLNELLDQRRSWESDPEVARLIRDSFEHRALAVAYGAVTDRQTLERVDRLPACGAPADLASRVLSELQTELVDVRQGQEQAIAANSQAGWAEANRVRWEPLRWFSVVLAVAATVLVAFGLSLLVPKPGTTEFADSVRPIEQVPQVAPAAESAPSQLVEAPQADKPVDAVRQPAATAPEEAIAQDREPTIGALMTEARDKYADLARDTQQAVSEVAVLLPGFGTRSSSTRAASNAAASDSGAVEGDAAGGWAGNVGEGLEPLTRSAVGALDFILQALPAGSVEPKS